MFFEISGSERVNDIHYHNVMNEFKYSFLEFFFWFRDLMMMISARIDYSLSWVDHHNSKHKKRKFETFNQFFFWPDCTTANKNYSDLIFPSLSFSLYLSFVSFQSYYIIIQGYWTFFLVSFSFSILFIHFSPWVTDFLFLVNCFLFLFFFWVQ